MLWGSSCLGLIARANFCLGLTGWIMDSAPSQVDMWPRPGFIGALGFDGFTL